MKKLTKRILSIVLGAALMLGLLSFSCSKGVLSANTAYADSRPVVSIPDNALSVVEALQTAFRAVSNGILPSVVEIDVVETKTRPANPFDSIPFFFFGQPEGSDESNKKQREYKQSGLGSGVIVRSDGKKYFVLTNNHVAGDATEITVKMNDGKEKHFEQKEKERTGYCRNVAAPTSYHDVPSGEGP